ncbi:MAG: hypothetical protein JSR62_02860 [Nitrospira sp.]|nr:hypothetical protein [Nitrospira sp.]
MPELFGAGLLRFFLTFLLLTSACAGPSIHTRAVQENEDWFVRLDSVENPDRNTVHYQHPATWTAQDLFVILDQLFIEQRVGLMDEPKPVQDVFSPEESQHILPALQMAFHEALPHEWVAFLLAQPRSQNERAITSGGLFHESDRLHIVVANHRTILPSHSNELVNVRANPLYSVNGSGGTLGIEPRRFVISTKANWSGGHRASASELVLDHRGYLAQVHLSDRRRVTKDLTTSDSPTASRTAAEDGRPIVEGTSPDSSTTIQRLESEIQQLKHTLADKQQQLERLKDGAAGQPLGRPVPQH